MIVRDATEKDVVVLADVHVRTWQNAYRGKVPQRHLDRMDPARRQQGWRQILRNAGPEILWVLATNDRARRFYETGGWRPDGATKTDDSRGFPLSEVRYRRAAGEPTTSPSP